MEGSQKLDNGKLPSNNNGRFELKLHDKTQRAAQIFQRMNRFKGSFQGGNWKEALGEKALRFGL
jgi:hypothetical protein